MDRPLELANSPWPRTGRDLRNSALAPFRGPTRGETLLDMPLPIQGAVVISENGDFLIAGESRLVACSFTGQVRWERNLREPLSAPMALSGGQILVNGRRTSFLLDSDGQTLNSWDFPGYGLDDSGPSPTLTSTGCPLFSGIEGQVWVGRGGGVEEIGVFGYDVLPPAVLPTGEIAIAGYAYTGACLIDERGEFLWKRDDFEDADSLVTVNGLSEMAFGNLNDRSSLVVNRYGADSFRVPYAATFSEHPGGWIAVSQGRVCRLDHTGSEKWAVSTPIERKFGMEQAACDAEGNIYVPIVGGIGAFDRNGNALFVLRPRGTQPNNVALNDGSAIYVCNQRLLVVV